MKLKSSSKGKLRIHATHPLARILLVAHDLKLKNHYQTLLADMGYLCDVAENGRQALSLITNHYDLMLIDASLPDINGVMLTKIIREELNHDPTKIIVFIRYEEIKRLCFHVGANAVIQKPIEENIFKDTMLKWLKH